MLVNNAGIRKDALMMWMEHEKWSGVLNTHLNGFFNVTQPLLKSMLVGRFGRVDEVADLLAFLVSDKASYITGEVISINGGLYT